jgi:hypothetical protein
MNVEMVEFACIPCNYTSPDFVERYEITEKYFEKLDAIYMRMHEVMGIPKSQANLKKFVSGSKKGYIPLCANFAMGMWWRPDSKDYWTKANDLNDQNISASYPKDLDDISYLGKTTL